MTSNTNCCVPFCHSKKSKNPELSYHLFPKDNAKRKVWQTHLKIGKPISDTARVCSQHFTKQDYHYINEATKRPRLKKGVVPTKNLPLSSVEDPIKVEKRKISALEREERYKQIKRKKTEHEATPSCSDFNLDKDHEDEDHNVVTAAEALLLMNKAADQDVSACTEETIVKPDASVQVCTSEIITTRFRFDDLNDNMLNSLTGLPSVKSLNIIAKYLSILNIPKRQLLLKDQIMLTLMRIKLNLGFTVLGAFFNVSKSTSKSIFVSLISPLAAYFKACIPWPTKDEIENFRPKVFQKFKSVRTIVDCTEIPISKFKCLTCKINSYSQYYGEQTVKYMVGISPGGLGIYLSKGYGGRSSDTVVFSESQLLEMLEPHIDSVMVDRGFLIDNCCAENFIKVVRPPFLKKGKFTANDCRCTKSIAGARVHVERFIQRIKIFKILHSKLAWNMFPYIDHVLNVITGIANLMNPIMSEKCF